MISSGTNLVMTVIGFGLSIMFIAFVCTRLICARIQLSASRRSLARANRSDLANLERGSHGQEPPALANFPMKKYGELCLSTKDNACERCTVCLADYHEEDTVCVLPVCGHAFHACCIGMWLQQQSTCPVCRVAVPERKWFLQPMFSQALRSQNRMHAANAHYCHCMANGNRVSPRSNTNEVCSTEVSSAGE